MSARDDTSSTSSQQAWRLPPDGYRSMSLPALREECARQHESGFRLFCMRVRDGIVFERLGDGWLVCIEHGKTHLYDAMASAPWRVVRLADDPGWNVTFFALLEEKLVVTVPLGPDEADGARGAQKKGGAA